LPWRRTVQGYYLNSQAFRDGSTTDLPDFGMVSLGYEVYSFGLGGLGIGYNVSYTVDRYGQAYLSILGLSFGAGIQPIEAGYYEGIFSISWG